jgi:hypothetical protein
LGYFVSPANLRTSLLPALAENPSVEEAALNQLAVVGSRSVVEVLLTSARVMNSPRLLQALQSNAHVHRNELAEIAKKPAAVEPSSAAEAGATEADATEADAPSEVVESTVAKYLEENAAELAAEKDKPFQPIGMSLDSDGGEAEGEASAEVGPQAAATTRASADRAAGKPAASSAVKPVMSVAAVKAKKQPVAGVEERRDSVLQKIAKLDIRGRITLAMRGSKEDRSILIRDSTKLVAIAVLESPKVSDGEVEKFALQKNVLEAVLRAIPLKRRFAKNYNIMRNLVQNPRTPLDLSLGLMKNLLIHDLKNLSGNKEVSDTIRKLALRMFKQKLEKKG